VVECRFRMQCTLNLVNDMIWFYGRRVIFMLCAKHSRAEADFHGVFGDSIPSPRSES